VKLDMEDRTKCIVGGIAIILIIVIIGIVVCSVY